MSKPVITLYVNDPMGKRWAANLEAAGRAEQEFGAQIVLIKKTSPEYAQEKDPPPCPSVMLNGRIIAKNDIITYASLQAALLSDSPA